jgi:hypothetical protein
MKLLFTVLLLAGAGCSFTSASDSSGSLWITHTGRYVYSISTYRGREETTKDTLALYILAEPKKEWAAQGVMQWQYVKRHDGVYALVDSMYVPYITGAFYNDSMFYIHPPREGKFKILEFSPHPFLRQNVKCKMQNVRGKSWEWVLPIGSAYSVDSAYQVSNVDTFYSRYVASGDTSLSYRGKSVMCSVVKADCTSKGRSSSAIYIYNPEVGILHMRIKMGNTVAYEMSLIVDCRGSSCIADNAYLNRIHLSNARKSAGLPEPVPGN